MDERLLNVNRYGVLQPTGSFWLACLILIRFQLFVLFALVAARKLASVMHVFDSGVPWFAMAAELPAMLLILVAGRRQPDAGNIFRFLWRNGKWLILITVLGHLLWAAFYFVGYDGFFDKADLIVLCFVVLDLALLSSFLTSDYYRQLFSEFPGRKSV